MWKIPVQKSRAMFQIDINQYGFFGADTDADILANYGPSSLADTDIFKFLDLVFYFVIKN